mmetsp:Transcript_13243/g.33646  ORF Transcript_13243/g.33646 Transcript_13243/m.33646 type:complete len:82 (-) Transcript_13243:446-691(-)
MGVGAEHQAAWKAGRLTKESELSKTIYNLFIKRNSSYVGVMFAVAIVGGIAFDRVVESAWGSHNKGKLFRDLKKTLPEPEE